MMVTKTAALLLAAVSIYSPVCFACGMSHYHRTNGNTACHSGGYWSGTQCMTNTVWYTADSNHARQTSTQCTDDCCPPRAVNCAGYWGTWASCSVPCGGGTKSRTYHVTRQSAGSGEACPPSYQREQSTSCHTSSCGPPPPPYTTDGAPPHLSFRTDRMSPSFQ